MYRPSQLQVFWFGVSADVPRITLREFYYFGASTQITLFRISADVRRKTPRDYYHFAHLRTIQCFGISADVRRKTAQDYFHFSAHTQVKIFWSFCGRTQKNSACLLPFCASTHNSVFWSFCGYTQILLLLKCDSSLENTFDVLIKHGHLVRLFLDFSEYPYGLDKIVTWADPDTHKPHRWKASSSPKVIYVAYIPTMFAKHIEQGKLIYK